MHCTQRYITVFRRPCHCTLFLVILIKFKPVYVISLKMLPFHLCISFPSDLFCCGIPTRILYVCFDIPDVANVLPSSFTVIWSSWYYWSSFLCNFLYIPLTTFLSLSLGICLGAPFWPVLYSTTNHVTLKASMLFRSLTHKNISMWRWMSWRKQMATFMKNISASYAHLILDGALMRTLCWYLVPSLCSHQTDHG